MNLIGMKVMHTLFGAGVVTEQIDDHITVEFATKVAKFVYPEAFDKFIKAEDTEIQALILENVKRIEAERERQYQEEITQKAAERQRYAALVSSPKTKKRKSIDEMFAPDYHVEKLARQPIFTYEQVEKQFGIKISGFGRGINSTDTAVVLISSIGRADGKFVYHDKWTLEGDYIYSGEGKSGDQTMSKGNLALKNAAQDGKEIHLFVKFSPQEYYYQGVFELIGYTYEDDNDEDENTRKEYKFQLKKVINE